MEDPKLEGLFTHLSWKHLGECRWGEPLPQQPTLR